MNTSGTPSMVSTTTTPMFVAVGEESDVAPHVGPATGTQGVTRRSGSSPWAPFHSEDFTRMASAQFLSNVGGWMQTVGAQELMLTLTTSATLVALVQTVAGLPVVLFALPAGAIGDLVDRRRLLVGSQSCMLLAALVLAALAFAGLVTPLVLLGLIFAVGIGQTLTAPTWQTLQPELVAPEDRTQAIALGAANQNLSRAIGPAIGGALYAATSAAALFLVNAVSFVPVIGAVARWRGAAKPAPVAGPEHVVDAIRAGARYVASSPALRVILLRAGLFMVFASSIWALLPLVAHSRLHLGSGGYGLLLGGVGVGAVFGAAALPRLRARASSSRLMLAGTIVFAAVTLSVAYVRVSAGGARAGDRRGRVDRCALHSELPVSVDLASLGEGAGHVLLPGHLPRRRRPRQRSVRRRGAACGSDRRAARGGGRAWGGRHCGDLAAIQGHRPRGSVTSWRLAGPAGSHPSPKRGASAGDLGVLAVAGARTRACKGVVCRTLRTAPHGGDPLARMERRHGSWSCAGGVRRRLMG